MRSEAERLQAERDQLKKEMAALRSRFERESAESSEGLRRAKEAASRYEAEALEKSGVVAELKEAVRILSESRQDFHDKLLQTTREREIAAGQRNSLRKENEDLSSKIGTLTEKVSVAEAALKTAVTDYQAGPDFSAAIADSCARGAHWMSQNLSERLPELSDNIRTQAAQLMSAAFPLFSPDDDDEADPPSGGGATI